MRINSKGQVTIPADLRRSHGFLAGVEVEVIADGAALRIVHATKSTTHGERVIERLRGQADAKLSTDELMALLRDD